MRHPGPCLLALAALVLAFVTRCPPAAAQANSGIVFVTHRPPREFTGNMHAWAGANAVHAYNEDTTTHTWHLNYVAFLSREPRAAEVTLVFYHVERNGTRRYISNEPVALSSPNDRVFNGYTTLHRAPGEFEPMENYEVAITVSDARGAHEIARGRVGLVGQVERHSGVVDFTGAAPVVH